MGSMAKLRGVLPPVGWWPAGGQRAGRRVDGEDRDAVVAAVGPEQKLPVGMDHDLGGDVLPVEARAAASRCVWTGFIVPAAAS